MYCVNATRKKVQRTQMSSDGRTVRELSRQEVSVATKEEYSGCARERQRKGSDQPQPL